MSPMKYGLNARGTIVPLVLRKYLKMLLLVISKGINELIYFSTSDITRNAVKHVSIVAAKHNFSVTFIYGNRLYQELSILPRFQYGLKIK